MLVFLSMIESPEDQDKFERIYLQYRYLMLYVANKILKNHYDAEDAVHQAFVAIIENLDKVSEPESSKTKSLVVLIAERKAIDILRKKQRENLLEINEEILGIEVPEPGEQSLANAMARLPAHYREVLLMRYDNGLSSHEIAKFLNITASGVRKILGRAKKKLEIELEKEGISI